jgi:hypothetical protein
MCRANTVSRGCAGLAGPGVASHITPLRGGSRQGPPEVIHEVDGGHRSEDRRYGSVLLTSADDVTQVADRSRLPCPWMPATV